MLKRIKEIQGVGTYVECKAGSAEYSKVTVVYGSNSYGKSTLCDVFRSLADGDAELIKGRKTIPAAKPAKVSLSFSIAGGSETSVNFDDGRWQQSLPGDLKIAVFDSNFISRNLFTGLEVDRKNKEALTDFVLGEQGVKHAELIAKKRKDQGQKQRDVKVIEKSFAGIKDIPALIALKVDETEETLITQSEATVRSVTEKKGVPTD